MKTPTSLVYIALTSCNNNFFDNLRLTVVGFAEIIRDDVLIPLGMSFVLFSLIFLSCSFFIFKL